LKVETDVYKFNKSVQFQLSTVLSTFDGF